MRRGLENALDECLAYLKKGKSLEECLQRFPKQRDELEPLLRVSLEVRKAFQRPAPSQQALARAKIRFMAEVSRRGSQQTPVKRARWFNWGVRTPLSRGLATAALTLVLILGILSGGSITSANSLPGDPLYGVKRVSERVRLFLTLGADNRADLQDRYDEIRIEEVKQVIEQKREVDVRFAGVVDSVEGDTIIVGGISINLPPDATAGERPVIGAEVQVVARTQDDGVVMLTSLDVYATPKAIALLAETTTPVPQERPTRTATTKPTSKPTPKPSATSRPTSTAVSSPTMTALPEETATITVTPLYTATITATMTATLTATPTPTLTATPTPTMTPTFTPLPPPRDIKVRIEGRIDEIGSGHWTVNGHHISILSSTSINQERARAQVGGWAIVDAIKKPDGRLIAREIVVVRGLDQPPQPREFNGVIESIAEDHWVVAGHRVLIEPGTIIEGTPEVGAIAYVKAEEYADGRLVAKRITVKSRPEQVVQFEGIIESISGDRWVIAGQEVFIGPETRIEGTPMVGAIAEVEAVVRADGSKLARYIKVHSPPSPEPTSTSAPEETPLTPSPELTATSAPEATPVTPAPVSTATPVPVSTPVAPTPRP